MEVTIKFFATLGEITGRKEEKVKTVENTTLGNLIEELSQKYGSAFTYYIYEKGKRSVNPTLQFLIDGINVNTLSGFKTKLKNGSTVAIIPPVGGG